MNIRGLIVVTMTKLCLSVITYDVYIHVFHDNEFM